MARPRIDGVEVPVGVDADEVRKLLGKGKVDLAIELLQTKAKLESMNKDPCVTCGGTGRRLLFNGSYPCEMCNGTGRR